MPDKSTVSIPNLSFISCSTSTRTFPAWVALPICIIGQNYALVLFYITLKIKKEEGIFNTVNIHSGSTNIVLTCFYDTVKIQYVFRNEVFYKWPAIIISFLINCRSSKYQGQ